MPVLCASVSVFVAAIYVALASASALFGHGTIAQLISGCAVFMAGGLSVSALAALIICKAAKVPFLWLWAVLALCGGAVVHYCTAPDVARGIVVSVLISIIFLSLLGVCAGVLWQTIIRKTATVRSTALLCSALLLLASSVVYGIIFYFTDAGCNSAVPASTERPSIPALLFIPGDPSVKGDYRVEEFHYAGLLRKPRRTGFASPDVLSHSVDGSAFVSGWSNSRSRYWGFDASELPLNATVHMPVGEGPFPLVLIVHGDAPMQINSDEGYGYLAGLLASRGYIAVSIDENFLNFSAFEMISADGLYEENDLRGWLLLEHLKLWRRWQNSSVNRFYAKADMNRIALIGHSRGGEAVAVAALFNSLGAYPGDGTVVFDYNFNISSVIAIAPAEGQYLPAGADIYLHDVNYLAIHGTHDMDVSVFKGLRQYDRVKFSGIGGQIKCAIAIGFANHGQFNERWGRRSDTRNPVTNLYCLRQLISADEQRRATCVYVSAFLESTLRNQTAYNVIFTESGFRADWLPDKPVYPQFASSKTVYMCTFDEDSDPATASLPGAAITCSSMCAWREMRLRLKDEDRCTNAVYLSWRAGGSRAASFTVHVPSLLCLTDKSSLVFSAAIADCAQQSGAMSFSIELCDGNGYIARLTAEDFGSLRPVIAANLTKAAWMQSLPSRELYLQSFMIPLSRFASAYPRFNPAEIRSISFVFDKTTSGSLFIDDIGTL